MRKFKGKIAILTSIYCVVASLFHIWGAGFGVLEPINQRAMHLTFMLPLAFILYPATKNSPSERVSFGDIILACLSIFTCLYVYFSAGSINERIPFVSKVTTIQIIIGIIIVALILEAVRRVVAPALMWIIIIAIVYVFVAPYLPVPLYNKHVSIGRLMEMLYIFQDTGVFGTLTGVSATFGAIFVVFAACISFSGVGKLFTDVSYKIAGKSIGGPAKVAVVSSALFGSISGVAAANVYATGSFTIPLMKKLGYRPRFAAAVETAASTGGLIMPPIMGIGAFVMAQIIGVPYLKICQAALPSAILYYVGIFLFVHFESIKEKLKPVSSENILRWNNIAKRGYLLIPLVLLVALIIKGYSPMLAAFWSIMSCICVIMIFPKEIPFFKKFKIVLSALELGAKNTVMIAMACAGAGIIVSILTCTGLSMSITSVIVSASHGILIFALMITMIVSILLGMGLPCVAAYIVAISVVGPVLLKLGVPLLQAHLFVYYFAILAALTPPVCIAAYAAASLAQSNPLYTGFEAMKLAIGGFLVPYVFIFNDALILKGSWQEVIITILCSLFSLILLSLGIVGYFKQKLGRVTRVFAIIFAILFLCLSVYHPWNLYS